MAGSPRFISTHGHVHAPARQMPMMRVYQSSASQNQPFLAATGHWIEVAFIHTRAREGRIERLDEIAVRRVVFLT